MKAFNQSGKQGQAKVSRLVWGRTASEIKTSAIASGFAFWRVRRRSRFVFAMNRAFGIMPHEQQTFRCGDRGSRPRCLQHEFRLRQRTARRARSRKKNSFAGRRNSATQAFWVTRSRGRNITPMIASSPTRKGGRWTRLNSSRTSVPCQRDIPGRSRL